VSGADVDVAVIGAGIVGLAAAAELARRGKSVVVIERREAVARELTSRNSQVVHAGLYYAEGSLKARLCARGRELLTERCARRGIPHRRTGKLVVAADESERAALEALCRRGTANGAPGLRLLEPREVRALEPCVECAAALESPASGVVDARALALSYAADAERCGADVALRTELVGLERRGDAWSCATRTADGAHETLRAAAVVNAAGLAADRVAALAGIDLDARGYRHRFCKGDWFSIAPGARLRVGRLVYPLPAGAGLGIHLTVDLAGRRRVGPDAEYVESPRFDVDAAKAPAFAASVRRYLPALRDEWLAPDEASVRPKLSGPGEPPRDFVVAEESALGLPGLVNCLGIESPGLTAAPAIAERVAELLR
jgi:L-2-hydroxyglutarate oxidase LhgO